MTKKRLLSRAFFALSASNALRPISNDLGGVCATCNICSASRMRDRIAVSILGLVRGSPLASNLGVLQSAPPTLSRKAASVDTLASASICVKKCTRDSCRRTNWPMTSPGTSSGAMKVALWGSCSGDS